MCAASILHFVQSVLRSPSGTLLLVVVGFRVGLKV